MAEIHSIRTENLVHYSMTEVVYVFIRDYVRREGFAPSLRDIAEGCDLGLTTVVCHLNRLRKWGFIKRSPTHSILLVDDPLPRTHDMEETAL